MNAVRVQRNATRHRRGRSRGFSLLELFLVIAVIGLLAAVAIERFLYYQERAEKITMESTLVMVRMGLQLRLADLIIANRQNKAEELTRENPMRWLEPRPANYAGDYVSPPKQGEWYYAADAHALVYAPSSNTNLEMEQGGAKELRFRVVIQYETSAVTRGPVPIGVSLEAVSKYKWF
jgi:general secretion pathway protein G